MKSLKKSGIDSMLHLVVFAFSLVACATDTSDRELSNSSGAGPSTSASASSGGNSGFDSGSGGSVSGGQSPEGGSETTGGTMATGGNHVATGGLDPGSGGTTSLLRYPSDILPGLSDWKISLPIDEEGNDSSGASNVDERNTGSWEVNGDDLVDFEYPPYFLAKDGEVLFRAHVFGATTSGSKYPRSELRQLVGGGDNYWSVQKLQSLDVEMRVTHLPVRKPEVSLVQIHGPEDEPLRVQYHEDVGVYIVWNETNKDTANAREYSLGERLKIAVTVLAGEITIQIVNLDRNESYQKTWSSSDSTGYFKVGCYTQSSAFLSEFKDGYEDEPADAYGEVAVSRIELLETYP